MTPLKIISRIAPRSAMLCMIACWAPDQQAEASTIYALSYGAPGFGLVSVDADTFAIKQGGILSDQSTAGMSVAVDETGRIFGFDGPSRQLLEFDPGTFEVMHSITVPGVLHGLAVHEGTIYSLSYSAPGFGLISFDADTFSIEQGSILSVHSTIGLSVAVDEAGRIFGFDGPSRQLLEFDRSTFEPMHSITVPGVLHGLAVREGTIYSLSYGSPGFGLISFDAYSFAIKRGSILSDQSTPGMSVAVDETGRIFGFDGPSRQLLEFDPDTFEVRHSTVIPGVLHGLAVTSIPEPSVAVFLAGGVILLLRRIRTA